MCNRACLRTEPETLSARIGRDWLTPKPMDNRSAQCSFDRNSARKPMARTRMQKG